MPRKAGGSAPNLLCQRSLTQGLHNADGNVDEFKYWVENGAQFLNRDRDMLLAILREYIKPTFADLCKGHGIDPTSAEPPKVVTDSKASGAEDTTGTPADSGVEDDDDFFTSSDKAGTIRAKNPYEVEVAIANALKDW